MFSGSYINNVLQVSKLKKHTKLSVAILTTLGLGLGATSFSAQALEAGDMFMRFTLTNVNPNDDSTNFTNVAAAPEVDDDTQLGVTFVYMFDSNIGFEVLAATPFSHDITIGGTKVAETKHLPPTFSVQYYFNPQTNVRPYVGLGLNYTTFFDSKTVDALGGDLDLDDSFGLAVQAGIDYDINEKWFVNADIRYMNIETTATNSVAGSSDVDINPTVISIGAGFRF